MAKFLVALDGSNSFNKNLFQLSSDLLGNMEDHLFVGMLVKDVSYINTVSNYIETAGAVDVMPARGFLDDEDDVITEVISQFEKTARDTSVRYEIYNDFRLTGHEVVKQSTYADLLILSYRVFLNYQTGKPDTSILYQILKGSKCPVLILPEGTNKIDNLIFTYDNKESSVFAIRAFSALFSGNIKDRIVSILSVMPNVDEEIKNEKLLLNLVKQHYNNVGIQLLEGDNISKEISNFANSVQNPLVVMGAYGRSHISNLLIPSVAQYILKESNLPLFIAHR
ncbi:MAG: universal stress protein [Cyclobacteriaceae bacterium]|nr:universal stress protein [Cyclobacteriaceae bacterium]